MSSLEEGLKRILWLIHIKLTLPYESKWQWTLHLGGVGLCLVYNVIIVLNLSSSTTIIDTLICLIFNVCEVTLTIVTPTRDRVFNNANVWVFSLKLISLVICLLAAAVIGPTAEKMYFFIISFFVEAIAGGPYIYYLRCPMNNTVETQCSRCMKKMIFDEKECPH